MKHPGLTNKRILWIALTAWALAGLCVAAAYVLYSVIATECLAQTAAICSHIRHLIHLAIAIGSVALVFTIYFVGRYFKSGKKAITAISLLSITAVAAISIFKFDSTNTQQSLRGDEGMRTSERALRNRETATRRPLAPPTAPRLGRPHPFPHIAQSREGMDMKSDPFQATSVAEQRWLDRNGYPNETQWMALLQATDTQLNDASLAGDKAAKSMLHQRRLLAGDETALDALIEDGARGSTFALELLSSTVAGPLNDPVGGYAWSRVVELRGNARVAIGRDVMLKRPLTPSERLGAEQQAVELFKKLRDLQRSYLGPNAPAVDPRPIDG